LSALKYLKEHEIRGFSVSYEVTHHGPTLDAPVMFVEVGSTPEQWQNEEAVAVVAEAIVASLKPENADTAVGFGGGHYAPRFSQIALKKNIAFGHMLPRYAFDFADEEMIRQAVERTVPAPKYYAVHGATDGVLETVERVAEEFGLKRVR
ncbi:TPA: D-tyrosyl-tRNA(Tyr) deacylase, partial [Candidatus Micrarchaeota archaeon]|nr:D-tyrosyl-tRNA(Tyr) deacylase [Candidatus Micrarchaeota archaeon]